MTARKPNALAKLMNQRGVSAAHLAAITNLAAEDVEAFQRGAAEPDADAAYLMARALDDSYRARLAIEAQKKTITTTLEGDGAKYAGITGVPYGTSDIGKKTGGAPS